MMSSARRSKRTQTKKAPDYTEDTISAIERSKSIAKAQRRPKGTPKPRKTTQITKLDNTHVKGRRGRLRFMTEMPLDILHEIFRELEPLDLVHLSWGSKSLRAIVMGEPARYIWKELFEKHFTSKNPPPNCPDDLNLAQYAHFLFTKRCMLCQTATSCSTCWELRLRICWDCLSSESFKPIPWQCSYQCVPIICAEGQRFCRAQDYHTYGKCDTIPRESRVPMGSRRKGLDGLNNWEEGQIKEREEQLDKLRLERHTAILNKLAEVGWAQSEVQEITYGITEKLPGFMKTGKFTDKEWDTLQPRLEKCLQVLKTAWIDKSRELKIPLRWRAYEENFGFWKEEQTRHPSLIPSAIDLAFYEPFKSAIFLPSDSEVIETSLQDFIRADKEWTDKRNNVIISMLPKGYSAQVPMDGTLQLSLLAVLMFRRSELGIGVRYTIDEFCQHRSPSYCHRPPKGCISPDDWAMFASIKPLTKGRPWLWDHKGFRFDSTAHKLAEGTLGVLGLDPRTTTISQMGEYKEVFGCTLCGEASGVDWRTMIKPGVIWHPGEGKKDSPANVWWKLIQAKV